MKLKIFSFFLLFICSSLYADPQTELKATIDGVLSLLKSKDDIKVKHKKLSEIFYQSFDIVRLSQMTLKSDWKKLSKDQKKVFVQKYSEYVLAFYTSKIKDYKDNNKIVYDGVEYKSKNKKALVKTLVEFQGAMAKINYSLRLKKSKWLIYDVEVEGVRLTSQYSRQFSQVLRKKSFEGLLADLEKLKSRYMDQATGK